MSETSPHTAALIARLAAELEPTPRWGLLRRLAAAATLGALAALIVVLTLWGPRPDFAAALATPAFWIKAMFSFALAAVGFRALTKLARPDGRSFGAAVLGALTIVAMGAAAVAQFFAAPAEARDRLLMGATSSVCPWLIMLLAIPILAACLWTAHAMAPTRLRLAGAAAGLTAGGLSAFVYAISCDESGLPFIFVWYGGAILAMSAIGALIGPRTLRW